MVLRFRRSHVSEPTLMTYAAPGPTGAVVLMLHVVAAGGVDGALHHRQRVHDADTSVWLLRYRERGWNGGHDRVEDARWALDAVRTAHGDVPVVLLGHSLGARVAVHAADDPSLVGVAGLAPWWSADDPVSTLTGRALVAAHGQRDRITSFAETGRSA
jgi:alpha/beta superfamily hydrolase